MRKWTSCQKWLKTSHFWPICVLHTHPSGKRMEVHHQALWRSTFKIRQQFGLKAQLGGWHNMSADALVREITAFHRMRRHDEVVDAIILAALE